MRCQRCGGCLVEEFLGYASNEALLSAPPAFRCCNCGNVEDPVIHTNRCQARSQVSADDALNYIEDATTTVKRRKAHHNHKGDSHDRAWKNKLAG